MVISSNKWRYNGEIKNESPIVETNFLMMATPHSITAVSTLSLAATATSTAGTLTTVGDNGTIINSNDTSDCYNSGCGSVARILLVCQPDSHPFQTRTIYLAPDVECKVGRSIAKSKSSDNNAIFDCKVLSRTHAVIWFSNEGKFYVKDTNSSNGTYINDRRINSSEPVELSFGDVVKFGVEVMENSRKEVHGCIIASVKPYLPDGREAISINQESPFRTESRISFEELHRLNLYLQETSQREKHLKSKLQNIQNVLDATRKNSTLCWQSMIDEDRLLNRIDLLESKLQYLQKKSPADQLKEEVIKLQEQNYLCQNSAKDALNKVYQERMDVILKLSKVERDYTCCENECTLLRDQIRCTKQNLQDVNTRLLSLEKEYMEYKDQTEKYQRETSEERNYFDVAVADLENKLKERDAECDVYKKKIEDLLWRCSERPNETGQQLKENDDKRLEDFCRASNYVAKTNDSGGNTKITSLNSVDADKIKDGEEHKDSKMMDLATNKCTIMKWLENSDLSCKEGSLDIIKAICSESDSSDDSELSIQVEQKSTVPASSTISSTKLINKLQLIDKNLVRLEAKLETHANLTDVEMFDNVPYQVLNYTVSLLREVYNEISNQEIQECLPTIKLDQPQFQNTLVKNEKHEVETERQTKDKTDYQYEIQRLQVLLENKESNAAFTVNTLQSESQILRDKMFDLTNLVEDLQKENEAIKNKLPGKKFEEKKEEYVTELFEKLIEEDKVAMNNAIVINEEELILYKDRFGKTQAENLKLKREIIELKLKFKDSVKIILRKSLTYVTVLVALILYLIFSYI